jgi:signal transduction histidine kinase
MFRRLKSVLPNGIAAQLTLLLAISGALALALLFLPFLLRKSDLPRPAMVFVERLVGEADIIDQLDDNKQVQVVARMAKQRRTKLQLLKQAPPDLVWHTYQKELKPHKWALRGTKLAYSYSVIEGPNMRRTYTAYAQLSNGRVLMAQRFANGKNAPAVRILTYGPVFILVIVAFFLIWAGRELVKPLRKLAEATDKISPDRYRGYKMKEEGPAEVRKVVRALNDMQDRIHRLDEDRTRMLAAVGHDLRTPVTRLRLRVEMSKDNELREDLLNDIEGMDRQLNHLLTYFRHGDTGEATVKVELASLLQSSVNQWSDAGYDVSLVVEHQTMLLAKPNELLRMIDNLVDNALKYGGQCEIRLEEDAGQPCIRIVDHGPGIPKDQREHLLKPFARGEKARTMDDKTGFGLGLSIAQAIALRHGIKMDLSTTKGGGLTASLIFDV